MNTAYVVYSNSTASTHNEARRVGVSPLPRFDFTLSAVESRSKIMFLSTSCQSGAKQTTNLKSPNISFKIQGAFQNKRDFCHKNFFGGTICE